MKKSVSGEILCSNFHKSHSLRRFVEQQVARCVRLGRLDPTMRYRVIFEAKSDVRTGEEGVACALDVSGGPIRWTSHVIGRKPKEAFSQCLNRLQPVIAA